jgi:hypothetical protein
MYRIAELVYLSAEFTLLILILLQILFNLLMIILLHLRQQRQNSVDETLQK